MKYSVVYLALYFCHCLIPDADPSVRLLPLSLGTLSMGIYVRSFWLTDSRFHITFHHGLHTPSSADKHWSRSVYVVKYTPANGPPRFCNDLECIGVPQQTPRECFIHYVPVMFFYTLHRVNNSHQGAIDPFLSLTWRCTGWIWFSMRNWWGIRCCKLIMSVSERCCTSG